MGSLRSCADRSSRTLIESNRASISANRTAGSAQSLGGVWFSGGELVEVLGGV